jgi:hypothetical protein
VTDDSAPRCEVCGEGCEAGPWILLSRYVVGGPGHGRMMTYHDDWEMHPEAPENDVASGDMLHWPVCASMYIDAMLAEQRVLAAEAEG